MFNLTKIEIQCGVRPPQLKIRLEIKKNLIAFHLIQKGSIDIRLIDAFVKNKETSFKTFSILYKTLIYSISVHLYGKLL